VTASAPDFASEQDQRWREVREVVLARDGHVCRSCGQPCKRGEADVHHLIARAAGGADEAANLITLCDGCHAAHHPNLQGTLARQMIERWGLRLARWLDRQHQLDNLDDSLGAALRLLGASRFRAPQLDVVLAALRGESLLFVSATGSGKSLCFQVPTLLRRGCGLVISPLKALMNQQVASLNLKKIPATFINGDLGPREKEIRYQLLRDGAIKFLYCTPERFDRTMVRPSEIREIIRSRPSYLIVDEAHCIDRWGNDFRPNYGRLGAVRRALGSPPVLAFTATAGTASQGRILESLGIPDARVIVTGVDRPNIKLARLFDVAEDQRYTIIKSLVSLIGDGRAMLFVPTVNVGKQLQEGLGRLGLEVPFYYSGLGTANDRESLLGRFTGRAEPRAPVVICTSAFGMGLDVPDVRLVVHWQHPASVEDYLQEFGRAGRDNLPSVAVLFTDVKDVGLLRYMAEKTVEMANIDPAMVIETLDARLSAIGDMRRLALSRDRCFRDGIVAYFQGPRKGPRNSLAVMLVDWLFSRSVTVRGSDRCCDHCDGVAAPDVVGWAAQILGTRSRFHPDVVLREAKDWLFTARGAGFVSASRASPSEARSGRP
jgi:ATP-dependent DNA helicase RecQ